MLAVLSKLFLSYILCDSATNELKPIFAIGHKCLHYNKCNMESASWALT